MNDFQGHRTIGSVCKGRSNNFDFIRFVAASLVIYSHAFPLSAGNEGELLKDLTQSQWSFGSLSVAVFFIISGFLIAQSYDQGRNPIKYIKARVLRIFPGLACVLVLSAFVLGPIVTQLPMKEYFCNLQTYQYLKSVFLYPLYWNLPGVFENNFYSPSVNGSLWTIPFEFFFYGVVLLLGILKLLQKKNINFALFLSFLLLEIYKHQLFPIEGHFMSLPRYSLIELGLYFSAGMLLYSLRDYVVLNQHLAMIGVYDYHPSYDDFDSHLQKLDEYGIRLVGMEWLDGCLLDRDNGMLLKLGQLEEGETNTWCYASDETRNRIQIRPINSEISISFDAAFVKSFGWLKQAIAEPFLQVVFRNENGELFTDQIAVEENGSYPMHYQLKVPEGTENIDVQFNIVDGNGNVQTNIAPYQMAVVVTQIAGCSISE